MSGETKRSGLKPLRSSTNLINNKSIVNRKSLLNCSLNQSTTTNDKQCEPKVSITEQIELNTSKIKSSNEIISKSTKKINKLTPSKPIKKAYQNIGKKKVKKAIQIILNKEQRIKKWLTSKETIEDSEYYRLYSERLAKELTEKLDRLDELELENELLIAEYEQISKLADDAFKLNSLLEKIGYSKLLSKNNSIEDDEQSLDDSLEQTNDCDSID